MFGRSAREDNLLVLSELLPLIFVEGDEFWTAQDDCAPGCVGVFAELVEWFERWVYCCDSLESIDRIDALTCDDAAFSRNCLRSEREVSGDLVLSVLIER